MCHLENRVKMPNKSRVDVSFHLFFVNLYGEDLYIYPLFVNRFSTICGSSDVFAVVFLDKRFSDLVLVSDPCL